VQALEAKLAAAPVHLDAAHDDSLALTVFPCEVWSNNPLSEQGDPQAHRRRRHLPRPGRHHQQTGQEEASDAGL